MNGMTLLGGSMCTLDGKPFFEIKDIQETDFLLQEEGTAEMPKFEPFKEICFECPSTRFDNSEGILTTLLGVRKRRKAKPVRKRLLNRLWNRYGRYRTNEYTLTPKGDGTWDMTLNGMEMNCNVRIKM